MPTIHPPAIATFPHLLLHPSQRTHQATAARHSLQMRVGPPPKALGPTPHPPSPPLTPHTLHTLPTKTHMLKPHQPILSDELTVDPS